MDLDLLDSILKQNLNHLKVNQYRTPLNGTLKIAEHYLEKYPYLSSKREKTRLDFYYNNQKFGFIRNQTPSTNRKIGKVIVQDKLETEKHLSMNGINTPKSVLLLSNDYIKGLDMVNQNSEKMVLKPLNLNRGDGITLNVDINNYEFAWQQAKKAMKDRNMEFQVLLQPMLAGVEARFLVVQEKFNSVILRVPANVIGDGEHPISQLINRKNEERLLNPHLKNIPIKINDSLNFNLKNIGYNLDSILGSGEIVYLQQSSNISLGGDSYEISHLIGDNLKVLAENSVRAIPGIETAGVDMLFTSFDDEAGAILEINSGSNLNMHHYPWKGTPKEPVFDLIDAMLKKYLSK